MDCRRARRRRSGRAACSPAFAAFRNRSMCVVIGWLPREITVSRARTCGSSAEQASVKRVGRAFEPLLAHQTLVESQSQRTRCEGLPKLLEHVYHKTPKYAKRITLPKTNYVHCLRNRRIVNRVHVSSGFLGAAPNNLTESFFWTAQRLRVAR